MEKDRKIKVLAVAALIITILGLTVAFAALSQRLTINGAATLDAASWGIKFENLSDGEITGDATINDTAVIADDLVTINNIDVSLSTPGDSVTYTVDLVNEGTINAEIYSIETPSLTEEQERYLNFNVTYDDGTEVKQGDILNQGERKNITIKIEFDRDITESDLPDEAQEIKLSYKLNFVQTDSSAIIPPTEEEDEMFAWESDTVITGLTEYGIEEVKANNGHLVIPEGVTEIAGTSPEEIGEAGTINTGFSPIAIGKVDMGSADLSEIMNNPEINIVKSVSFPSTLKKIGDYAFAYCINLTNVNLPTNLENIGVSTFAFSGVSGELVIPNNVTSIGHSAFYGAPISSLKLGNSINNIDPYAFYHCENLTGELIIPDSVTIIDSQAFQGTSISSLKLGDNVETIGSLAFSGCANLSGELYIPDSVKKIGNDAFGGVAFNNNKITSISISKNTQYGSTSFQGRPTPTVRES